MAFITAKGETFFLIAPHHADFVRDENASLREPILIGWRRWLFFIILIAIGITALSSLSQPTRYEREAIITDKGIEGNEFQPQYRLTYAYIDHRNERHEVSQIVEALFYDELGVGSQVTVAYLEGQSHRAQLSGRFSGDVYNLNNDFIWFLALALVVLWMLLFWIIFPTRKTARLRREGMLLKGVMTNIYPIKTFRRYDVVVEYTFAVPNGNIIEARANQTRNDLEQTTLPKSNTPILVLYVNDHLYRLM
jgi:hypothetical protein